MHHKTNHHEQQKPLTPFIMSALAPCVFISHGGPGGMLSPGVDEPAKQFLAEFGKRLLNDSNIKGVVALSAHWYSHNMQPVIEFTQGKIIHDFGEFFDGIYDIQYDIKPFSPDQTRDVISLLNGSLADFKLKESRRGVDHGLWIPWMNADPHHKLPVLQIQIPSEDPKLLARLGEQLQVLRKNGYAVVLSGGVVHNLPILFNSLPRKDTTGNVFTTSIQLDTPWWAKQFETVLFDKCLAGGLPNVETFDEIIHENAQLYNISHPTDDHFAPMYVAFGCSTSHKAKRLHESWSLGSLGMHAYEFD